MSTNEKRILDANYMTNTPYSSPVAQLLTLDDPRQHRKGQQWFDYATLGLTVEHIPDLIRLALDDNLNTADVESAEVWAPLHAWRALGQLRAEAAIEPLLTLLPKLIDIEDGDDWAHGDFPLVFGLIGPAAIPALSQYLADDSQGLYSRAVASHSLTAIAQQYPASRADCVAAMARALENFAQNNDSLNAFLIGDLLELKAVECAPLIERAYAANRVEEIVNGDWEDAQIELGLKSEREHPPQYNLVRNLFGNGAALPDDDDDLVIAQSGVERQAQRLAEKKEKAKRKAAEKAKKKRRKKKR